MDRFPIIYTFGSILDYGIGLLVGVLIGGAVVWAWTRFCNWLDIQTLKALHKAELIPPVPEPEDDATPVATATYHPSVDHLLQFFSFGHLPLQKAVVSKQFSDLAYMLADILPGNPETTVALRKLLEAKDAAVRSTFSK